MKKKPKAMKGMKTMKGMKAMKIQIRCKKGMTPAEQIALERQIVKDLPSAKKLGWWRSEVARPQGGRIEATFWYPRRATL